MPQTPASQYNEPYINSRISFQTHTCTVRWIGSLPDTKGTWLGVEWDDPGHGKHDGVHNGKRYFKCDSGSPTAGSFVRASRPRDPPRGFLDAVREKYATDAASYLTKSVSQEDDEYDVETSAAQVMAAAIASDAKVRSQGHAPQIGPIYGSSTTSAPPVRSNAPIQFGNKIAEEVGFAKVAAQQANLKGLQIVVLSRWQVAGLSVRQMEGPLAAEATRTTAREGVLGTIDEIRNVLPRVTELDLGKNLLERWSVVLDICAGLPRLKSLKLSGNRFSDLSHPQTTDGTDALGGITDLSLDGMFLPWHKTATLAHKFRALTSLSVAANNFNTVTTRLETQSLTSLNLAFNAFSSLSALSNLTSLPNLQRLSLQSNAVTSLECPAVFAQLTHLDLSANLLPTFSALNPLSTASFPSLVSLRVSRNPFFTTQAPDVSHMLALARIPNLNELNYSPIDPAERVNGELYYLSRIAAELTSTDDDSIRTNETKLSHPQWDYLCRKHDYALAITSRDQSKGYGPGTLGARLIQLTINRPRENSSEQVRVPRTISIYALKALLAKRFKILPLSFALVWETGEWDPVGRSAAAVTTTGAEEAADNDVEDDAFSVSSTEAEPGQEALDLAQNESQPAASLKNPSGQATQRGRFVRREVRIREGTSSVGFWVEGDAAILRVEEMHGAGEERVEC